MIQYTEIEGRKILLKGVGKLFYQEGFPVSMAIAKCKENNIEVSIFHVADECLKHGWSPKTTYNKLVADLDEDIDKHDINKEALYKFCYSDYDTQRQMIFEYLFGGYETAKTWMSKNLFNEKCK